MIGKVLGGLIFIVIVFLLLRGIVCAVFILCKFSEGQEEFFLSDAGGEGIDAEDLKDLFG